MFAIKHSFFFPAALVALLAVSATAQTTSSPAQPLPFTRNFNLPPVGLAGTETLQVNVANLPPYPAAPNVTTATGTCTGTISFANASGTAIGTPVSFTVASGQIFSAPLPFSKTGYSDRGEILASVQTACSLGISLETFDTGTGVTHAFLTAIPAPAGQLFSVISPTPLSRQ